MAKTSQTVEQDTLSAYSQPQKFSALGYLIVFLVFAVCGTWTALAKIDSATVAQGIVELEGNRKVVQHLSGGIVKSLHVREADTVAFGDVLITLESVEARSNMERLRNRLIEARAIEARLQAENTFSPIIGATIGIAAADQADFQTALNSQQKILDDRLAIYQSQKDILTFRLQQLQNRQDGMEQQRTALEQRVRLHRDLVERLASGEARGVVQRNELDQRRDTLIQIEANLGKVIADTSQAGVAIAEAQLNLLQLANEFQERANLELNQTHTDISELEETFTVARDTFERSEIRSPANGVIQALSVNTEGSVIRPGATLMEIVPDDGKLVISARISPTDIDSVSPGQESEVRLVAFNAKLTPILLGTVESVSGDIISPQAPGEAPYYLARIRVPEAHMTAEIRDGLTPGMPADVVIVNGERSVLSYLASPLTDAIAKSFKEQ